MFLEKIGLVKNIAERVKEAIEHLKTTRERMVESGTSTTNPAKQLAQLLYGKIPIVYAGPTLMDVVALRWKSQICENSKSIAFANVYPEFNHNELVGWTKLPFEKKEHFIVLNLRGADDHEKVSLRMDVVKRLIEEQEIMVIDLYASGETEMQRVFNLIQMGDFVSYYLAILADVDPSPVEIIENLKKELANPNSTS